MTVIHSGLNYTSGAITATKKLVGVSGSFIIDDVNTYAVTSEMKIDQTKSGITYTPLIEIRRPDTDNVALTGMVTMESMKSATADLTLAGLTAQPLAFKSECMEHSVYGVYGFLFDRVLRPQKT